MENLPDWLDKPVCTYLVALNTVADFSLHDLDKIGIAPFVLTCDYFGFDKMMSCMIDQVLTIHFRHALEFWYMFEKVHAADPMRMLDKIRESLTLKYHLYATEGYYHDNIV